MSNVVFLSKGAVQDSVVNPPTKETVSNSLSYSDSVENWNDVDNVTVDDGRFTYGRISLALITDDGTDAVHVVGLTNAYDVSGGNRRVSIYVAAGTARYITLSDRLPNASNVQWNNIFDTQTGAFTETGTLHANHEVSDEGNGVFRISFTDNQSSAAYDSIYIGINSDGTLAGNSYAGSGDTIYAGGAQVELVTDASPGTRVLTTGAERTQVFGGNVVQISKGAVQPTAYPSIALSGSIIDTARIADIVAGGKEIVLTLDGAAWAKPSRQNLITHSGDLTHADWIKSRATIEQDAVVGPAYIGGFADRVVEDTTVNNSHLIQSGVFSTDGVSQYRLYCHAKFDGSRDSILISTAAAGFPNNAGHYFNIENGVLGASYSAGVDSAAIIDKGDGYYLCEIYLTSDDAGITRVQVQLADGNDRTYTGDGVSGVYITALQVQKASEARDYIETVDDPVIETGFTEDIERAIIDGLDSDGIELTGWNTLVRDALDLSAVVRTSNSVVTITLPVIAGFDIEDIETITATIDSSVLNNGITTVASPTFQINLAEPSLGGGSSTGVSKIDRAARRRTLLKHEDEELLAVVAAAAGMEKWHH